MKAKFLLVAAILFGMGISSVNAQAVKREKREVHRIKQGVRSGELTKRETKHLVKDQREIRQDVRLAKSDGIITPGEKRTIRKEQKKESREIFRKKHNNRDRN